MGPKRKAHMNGVEITAQSVKHGLRIRRLFLDDGICLTLGWFVRGRGGSSICPSPVKEESIKSTSETPATFPDPC